MIKGGHNMKKIVFLLIVSMIVISSISFVAADSDNTNRVSVKLYSNDIEIVDHFEANKRGYSYGQYPSLHKPPKNSADFQTYDIDHDGNANFLIDNDKNFLICDFDNDGAADLVVDDYDNDGDLDIIKNP